MERTNRNRMLAVGLILRSVGAQTAVAFIATLQPESVREAYFFGRGSDRKKVSDFLEQDIRNFPIGSENPSVGRIEFCCANLPSRSATA